MKALLIKTFAACSLAFVVGAGIYQAVQKPAEAQGGGFPSNPTFQTLTVTGNTQLAGASLSGGMNVNGAATFGNINGNFSNSFGTLPVTYAATFGGTGTCTIANSTLNLATSCTRLSTGVYKVNFTSGIFPTGFTPICVASTGTTYEISVATAGYTSNSITVTTENQAGALIDSATNFVHCTG